jgi:arylsulfatase
MIDRTNGFQRVTGQQTDSHRRAGIFLSGLCYAIFGCYGEFLAMVDAAEKPPNIIFIITDDQGYGELSRHGNTNLSTPSLDLLSRQSVNFTNFHASPTCAPTRSALMTGRHEFRNGVTHTIQERERLRLDAVTLPQLLKTANYQTGIFGKWHLGDEDPYQPGQRGFDEVFIHGAGGIGQSYPGSCGDAPGNSYFGPYVWHNDRFVKTSQFCTDVFFRQAFEWMNVRRQSDEPFFAYISTNAPHAPYVCPDEYAEPFLQVGFKENEARYYGMIVNIDKNVGQLLDMLKRWKLDESTIVIFMTDNGHSIGSLYNANMRGAKGTPYMGGTRVPCFVRWIHQFPRGVQVPALTAHIDLLPTLTELAGVTVPDSLPVEGRSLVPLLRDPSAPWPDRMLFTHVGRWERGKASESKYLRCRVRNTRFTMVSADPKGQKAWELFDLENDPGETTNALENHPQVAARLEAAYDEWWESIQPDLVNEDAVGPDVNPFKERFWKQFPDQKPKE